MFGYFNSAAVQATAKPVDATTTVDGFTRYDFGAALGGFILKDRLWFFGAYDRVHEQHAERHVLLGDRHDAGPTVHSKSDSTANLGSAKLTFAITPSQTSSGRTSRIPSARSGAINDPDHPLYGDPLTYLGDQDFGGRDYSVRYTGSSARTGWRRRNGRATRSEQRRPRDGGRRRRRSTRTLRNNFFQTGGFGLVQDKDFQRDFYGGSLTRYLANHELKFGAEYEQQTADVFKRKSGGQLVTIFQNTVTSFAAHLFATPTGRPRRRRRIVRRADLAVERHSRSTRT